MDNTFTRFETHPAGGLQPSADTPQEAFSTGDQTELDFPYFADDNGVSAGVWECAPSRMVFDQYPVHEMMTILSGSVTLTSLDDDRIETQLDQLSVTRNQRAILHHAEAIAQCISSTHE